MTTNAKPSGTIGRPGMCRHPVRALIATAINT
jgi:hypothetical protein